MTPGPVRIETSRLIVREFRETDWEAFDRYSLDPAAARAWPEPVTPESTRRAIETALATQSRPARNCFHLAVEEHTTGTLVGDVDISHMPGGREAEFGIILAPAARGQGFGTELGHALAHWAMGAIPRPSAYAVSRPRVRPSDLITSHDSRYG